MSFKPTLTVKTGDRYPTTWTVPMNITGATVRLIAKRDRQDPIVLPTTIVDADNGVVEHILDGSLPRGDYRVELEVTLGGVIITAPTDSYVPLRVIEDLD